MKLEHLLALRGQAPPVDISIAEQVARDLYGLTGHASGLAGERDRNFQLNTADGRRYILKFIDAEADDVIVAGQSAVLAHLAASAVRVPVPTVIPTRAGTPVGIAPIDATTRCRVRLVSCLPGTLMQAAGLAPAPLLRSVGRRIAELDQALRDFTHPALAQPIVWDIRQAPALQPILADVRSGTLRQLLAEALESVDALLPRMSGLRSQAIHGDCHGRNILIDRDVGDCVGIIDFGDMIQGPLALELAIAVGELLVDGVASTDSLTDLISAYASVEPLKADDVDVLYDMARARIAVGALVQVWRETHAGDRPLTPGDGYAPSINALTALAEVGRSRLQRQWMDAAGISSGLRRRRLRALGAHAELSYDRPLHLVRAEGVWVFTAEGDRLLDVYNNVPHVGHAHPVVAAAISRQCQRIASNTRYLDERIVDYAERLTAKLPADLDTCLFVNSGSEANDIAWRMAKSYTGHSGALVAVHAYHGITEAVTGLSPAICAAVPTHVEQFPVPLAGADAAQSDALHAIARLAARGHSPAALLLDSALTSSGIYDLPPESFTPLATAVQDAGGLIIGDEVQYGLGRSGSHFWGFARRGYHPDIVTLGKPVGNGFPLGVVMTRRSILEKFQRDSGFFSTFGGNPVAAAAGLAVLEVLEKERLVENARTTGAYFIDRLRQLAAAHACLHEVRGAGLMIGVEVTDKVLAKCIVNGLRDRGVLIGSEGPLGNVLKLRPPMPFRPPHVDLVIDALTATLRSVPSG